MNRQSNRIARIRHDDRGGKERHERNRHRFDAREHGRYSTNYVNLIRVWARPL
jgi:hypothetical protein